jgi:hypothetical protein
MIAITLFQWRNISVPFALVCVGAVEEPPDYNNERENQREKGFERCPTEIYIS